MTEQRIDLAPIIAAFDLEQFLDGEGIKFSTSSGQFITTCPSCGSHDKFYIGIDNKLYICFKCEIRGNLISYLSMVSDRSVRDVIQNLCGGIRRVCHKKDLTVKLSGRSRSHNDDETAQVDTSFAVTIGNMAANHVVHQYLSMRGITHEMIDAFDLKYADGMMRLIFPLFDRNKELFGWVGRDITGTHELKYFNNIGLKKSQILYGQHLHWEAESIVLAEGPVDAIKCLRFGGLAMLGKTLSTNQLNLLLKMPNLKRVYIGIDPDQPQCAINAATALKSFFDVRMLKWDSRKDLGDRTPDNIATLLDGAVAFNGYVNLDMVVNLS